MVIYIAMRLVGFWEWWNSSTRNDAGGPSGGLLTLRPRSARQQSAGRLWLPTIFIAARRRIVGMSPSSAASRIK
jgi:hypothetical protein